jgi:hypothetical protein
MISSDNPPKRSATSDEDFTEQHYRQLLRTAKAAYRFVTYDAIPWGTRFILWRHDLDFSINRAAALASIEAEEGVTATYFVNPRSEYYNPFEPGQVRLLRHILGHGHRLGLHFDAAFHGVEDEETLHSKVAQEARWLDETLGVRPDAFSFHNPGADHLRCDADHYGGLVNCYSGRFKTEVPYCSDSNGYWRFRRLHDVLTEASDRCLQVLTHPGWWQSKPMPPRQRIFRSAYGRAQATMNGYDAALVEHGRINHAGLTDSLCFLQPLHPRAFALCDYLWNQGYLDALFVELWRLHEAQVNRLCKAVLRKVWRVPASDVNAFFGQESAWVDGFMLFRGMFGETWQTLAGLDAGEFSKWVGVRNQLVHGKGTYEIALLEQGCVLVCDAIARLAVWGLAQPLAYDGLAHLGSIGLPTLKTADGRLSHRLEEVPDEIPTFPTRRWEALKCQLVGVNTAGIE